MDTRPHIAVIGAGLMGHGIALTFARAGHVVMLFDPVQESLHTAHSRMAISLSLLGETEPEIVAALGRTVLCGSLAEAVREADYVFEAAPEKLELKRSLFADIEEHASENAVLASNTSVIPISKIMSGLLSRERALGTHWWNPPHMIPLVEVIKTEWTEASRADDMMALLSAVGKTPVLVKKDVPGFIGNRLQHALWREAISLVERGVCTAEAVDDVVKSSFGRRLAVLGPLENADLVGIELTQDIHNQVLHDLDNSTQASPYLQALLDQGHTGMSAGHGLRQWREGDVEATKERIAQHLTELEAILPKKHELEE